jgi:hypothetical protein
MNILTIFFSSFFRCPSRVRNWALKFGVDLWEFGRQFTKMNDIKNVSNKKIYTKMCSNKNSSLFFVDSKLRLM